MRESERRNEATQRRSVAFNLQIDGTAEVEEEEGLQRQFYYWFSSSRCAVLLCDCTHFLCFWGESSLTQKSTTQTYADINCCCCRTHWATLAQVKWEALRPSLTALFAETYLFVQQQYTLVEAQSEVVSPFFQHLWALPAHTTVSLSLISSTLG